MDPHATMTALCALLEQGESSRTEEERERIAFLAYELWLWLKNGGFRPYKRLCNRYYLATGDDRKTPLVEQLYRLAEPARGQ